MSSDYDYPHRNYQKTHIFFFVWLREQDEWKIVISHDAVSIDPANPGFEAP